MISLCIDIFYLEGKLFDRVKKLAVTPLKKYEQVVSTTPVTARAEPWQKAFHVGIDGTTIQRVIRIMLEIINRLAARLYVGFCVVVILTCKDKSN